MRVGLVMEGGAMRGMFTAGVIDVLMEKGIDFDGAVGVSAGATFGCNIKSRQIGRAIRYNMKYCKDPRYGTVKSFLKTGNFFDEEFCYHELPERLDVFDTETFSNFPMDFYVVAVDVETAKPVYHKLSDGKAGDIKWIGASASVPLEFFENTGYERNLVILTQPDSYRKKKNKATPLCRIIYRKYPEFVKLFANRHIYYNGNIDYVRKRESDGTAFVIRPPHKLELKSAEKDPANLKKAYDLGREEALKAINERGLKEWLENAHKA